MFQKNARLLPLLVALAMSSTGCATNSTPSPLPLPARLPPPSVELMEPPPSSGSYSANVQRLLSTWRERLTDSRPD